MQAMTPEQRRELDILLENYRLAVLVKDSRPEHQALIAFVDRLAVPQAGLHQIIKAQAALLVSYRIGGRPAEWVFKVMDESRDEIQAILKGATKGEK